MHYSAYKLFMWGYYQKTCYINSHSYGDVYAEPYLLLWIYMPVVY